jgi:hypothetical protein
MSYVRAASQVVHKLAHVDLVLRLVVALFWKVY